MEIQKKENSSVKDFQSTDLVNFLSELGLPSQNIIATAEQRSIMAKNLGEYINSLPAEAKTDARYLAKFVVGAGVGLFDYSLNAIWNKVIIVLRKKAIFYGLDIFFDAAVGGSRNRDVYESEEDLSLLKDSTLIDTCRKLELISDLTCKKLKHILDMRNDIGISHPNDYSINAYELLGWLDTCVKELIQDQPTESAIRVQSFIRGLKAGTDVIDAATLATIERKLAELPTSMCGTILRTLFGIYVARDTTPVVRKNVSQIAPFVWKNCKNEARYKLGHVLEGYKSNLEQEKYELGDQFFAIVEGNNFRTESEKALILGELLNKLSEKHYGFDNFSHETPLAKQIATYVNHADDIPNSVAERLYSIVLMCRIGRNVSYCDGISPGARPHYEKMIALAGDSHFPHLLSALRNHEVRRKMSYASCRNKAVEIFKTIRPTLTNKRLIECAEYIISSLEKDMHCLNSSEFRTLTSGYIDWSE
ncbi:MAG: hypothetical protein IOC52_03920 [Methylobacterium sp.]|nr:hypothetical protein [Methylobacterium sp.]